jgi:hypothetical protein
MPNNKNGAQRIHKGLPGYIKYMIEDNDEKIQNDQKNVVPRTRPHRQGRGQKNSSKIDQASVNSSQVEKQASKKWATSVNQRLR